MIERQTEQRPGESIGLELRSDAEILALLAAGQAAAAAAVSSALDDIGRAANLAAASISSGGRLIYAAAGSSGLMALADALELPGTFGIARDRVVVLLAGGMGALTDLRGGPEDDGDAAREEVLNLGPGPDDCLIALTASGRTPYAVEAARAARLRGARTIGLSNNADAPLFEVSDVAVHLPTPPEVVAGSTRMGAGSAQKIALNMLSTLMAIRLGHVHDGLMVNVVADNDKLRDRARGIVAAIAGVDAAAAGQALEASGGGVKAAVLIGAGASDRAAAEALLRQHRGFLRPALDALQMRKR
jgi:N-acetylmuramic acid 6-phosphate etherase